MTTTQQTNGVIVSTITPCFHMKPYLKVFLEELPNQTYFDKLEVVLDHNEPDDEEIFWVQEFQKKYPGRIKHIITRPVEVIGASMNRCIAEAQGKYVTIWNVDDLRTPDSIESQVRALEEKNGDIAFGNFRIVRRFGEKDIGRVVDVTKIPEREYARSMVYGPFFMFKKTLCQKAGYFDEQLRSGADFDLEVRLAHHGKTVITDRPLGYYLDEGKGASTRPDSKQATDALAINLRYGNFEKVNLELIPKIISIDVPHIYSFGNRNNVSEYIPNYAQLIEANSKLIKKSITSTSLQVFTRTNNIKRKIKSIIKKKLLERGYLNF